MMLHTHRLRNGRSDDHSISLRRLCAQPDFRREPLRAIARRAIWHLRWLLRSSPWCLRTCESIQILVPHGGAGALIYYRGHSEPEIASFLKMAVKPGMTFWDVGAHVGEFTLLAAKLAGENGRVEAIEPQANLCDLIRMSLSRNGLRNTTVRCAAVTDSIGFARLVLPREPSLAYIQQDGEGAAPSIEIQTLTLDRLKHDTGRCPNFIKVDVEGAERLVLCGAESLLSMPPGLAPTWIVEFEQDNCARFSYAASELLSKFTSTGHRTHWLRADGSAVPTSPGGMPVGRNFLAFKVDSQC